MLKSRLQARMNELNIMYGTTEVLSLTPPLILTFNDSFELLVTVREYKESERLI